MQLFSLDIIIAERMNDGIILLDKEAGLTSRAVDNLLQKKLGTRHIGHLGTLDPFATGLLVIGVNKGTKLLAYLDDAKKSYIATLRLGGKTLSGDLTDPVVESKEIPTIDDELITGVLRGFLGKSTAKVPSFSAIKVNGEALYKAAHRGEDNSVGLTREREVFSLNLVAYSKPDIVFTVTVSKGTYIRTLGEDIAERLGTLGYLTALRRLSVGPFMVDKAVKIEALNEESIFDPTIFIRGMKHFELDEAGVFKALNGQRISLPKEYSGNTVLLTKDGMAFAVYQRDEDGLYHSLRGLF